MKKFTYILIMSLLGGILLADTCAASICAPKEAVVFFGNGINTTKTKAHVAKDLIKKRLETIMTPEELELLSFKLSYNETGGAIIDLFESTIQSLTLDATLNEFKAFLTDNNLYVFTVNGFPYGNFHGTIVKENVYSPDWRSAQRVQYTCLLADILARLLPPDITGSISTVPCS